MKAVILCGGLGTRISEESHLKPKPMIEIGGKPILWHIMKIYSYYGYNEFIICLGYKGYIIKEYFAHYFLHSCDVTFDMEKNQMNVHEKNVDPWRVTLVDTGEQTQTGGRIKRIANYLEGETDFCLTYGDGVANINILELVNFHKTRNSLATLTAIQPPGRFGVLGIEKSKISGFHEKPPGDNTWINGGFFVLSTGVLDYIENDQTVWEKEPIERLAKEDNLSAFFHDGFWQCMDTMRDRTKLESLWESGNAPWKVWD